MTNGEVTRLFFAAIGKKATAFILTNIADHYGISQADARDEITSDESESLLDYVTGATRAATSVMLQGLGLSQINRE